jgi:hypothetical protein
MTDVHHTRFAEAFIQRAAVASALYAYDSTLVDDVKEALAKLNERRNGLGFRFLRQVEIDADNDMLVGIRALEGLLQQLQLATRRVAAPEVASAL